MSTYKQIAKAVNAVIREKYPEIPIYMADVVDGTQKPYFFVEIRPTGVDNETKNMRRQRVNVFVTFNQKKADFSEDLDVFETLRKAFGMYITSESDSGKPRKLLVLDYSSEYVGKNNNIMQIYFNLDWYVDTEERGGTYIEYLNLRTQTQD